MGKYESDAVRNIILIGHGAVGKTTLCEAMLHTGGKTDRLGKVDDGSSCMDFEPEEQKRRGSINSAFNFVERNKHKINIIDTPGDANFAYEVESCMAVADGAVLVVDGTSGVEFQTGKVNSLAENNKVPRIIFISRLDRERADFYKAVDSLAAKLGIKPTPLFLPLGAEANLEGLIDLVNEKALIFSGNAKGDDYTIAEIPADLKETAKKYRDSMVEDVAESEEALMEKYLADGDLSLEDLKKGIRGALIGNSLVPVVCGVATKSLGISPLLDAIIDYMPSPIDRGAITGAKPDGAKEERQPQANAPFSALVCKTLADPYAGKLTIFRVFSGSLSGEASVFNPNKKCTERCNSVFFLEGKTQKPAEALVAGDIAAVAKLKETTTGDTLCNEKNPILLPLPNPASPVMSFAVEPKSRGDEEKIVSSINRLIEEDPSLKFFRNDETHEMILSGSGQVHIEVTVEKMKRKFGVEVNLKTPRVPYKETIKGKTNLQSKYKKQSGGRGQYGDCWLDIEPAPRGTGFEFADKIVGGVIPQQYRPAVEKGIVEAMAEGIIAGYPVVDVKVSLTDGSYHTVDSSEMAFKIAGSMGFKKGFMDCQPILLEPIANIEVEIPEEYMGDVIGDLNSRRGRIAGMETRGSNAIVKAQVPLAEIQKYAPDLRSMTSGRGSFSYVHSHYEELPAHLTEKVIAEAKKEEAEKK
ncbi:MAG: elongation factor G [Deltaproteobacteria bacterium]|nr:elongation factor G [Deltaproteobacteria bacterium]